MPNEELVLVAEDNPDDALLLKRAVVKAGINARILILKDGEEMLEYLRTVDDDSLEHQTPSLIILDLKMPRKSGLEVLEWLSEHPEYTIVPTVVMSSSNLENDVRTAYRLGANTYFVKPGTFHELVETMKSLQNYWSKATKVNPDRLSKSMAAAGNGKPLESLLVKD